MKYFIENRNLTMKSKENYCYGILKKYSLLIDFDGHPPYKTVPSPTNGTKNETYGQWKLRVLGKNVTNVVIYTPAQPANQTKINTLTATSNVSQLDRIIQTINKKNKVAVKTAIEKTEKKHTYLAKDALEDILENKSLEPSIKEFFSRYLEKTKDDIPIELLLDQLIDSYNTAVRLCKPKAVNPNEST